MSINQETKWTKPRKGLGRIFTRSLLFSALLLSPAVALGQVDSQVIYGKTDSVTVQISAVMQELFWRVRANDNTVFYENEFPHLRETMNIDTYLGGVRFRQIRRPNSDSIIAITVDSAKIFGDTALAYLNMVIRPPGSDTVHTKTGFQKLYYYKGAWIRPLSTTPKSNDEYYRRIQRYEEDAEGE